MGLLGAGGMGRVYLARDRRLDRMVALKEALAADTALAREARVTAGLEHPGIVAIYDEGVSDEGKRFYVMRLVRGRPLSQCIAETPALADRLRWVRAVLAACEAVAYAHARGVIHRDLKPANIVLGEHGETQVVDWGLAVNLAEADAARPAGTPAYMSPEVRAGAPADRRSDVWGLGAVLAELVSGLPPASRPGPTRGAPPELVSIAERALRSEPADRYPDAAAMAEDLTAYLDGRRVSAYAYSPGELALRLARAWRAPLLVGALSLAVLVVVGARSAWALRVERDRAVAAEAATHAALARTDHVLAAALVQRARDALLAGSLTEAELLSANALVREDSPEARGILAGARAGVRPRRVATGPAPDCQSIVALDVDETICGGEGAVWRSRGGEELWRVKLPVRALSLAGGRLDVDIGETIAVLDPETGASAGPPRALLAVGGIPHSVEAENFEELRDAVLGACGPTAVVALATDGSPALVSFCADGPVVVLHAGQPSHRAEPGLDRTLFADPLATALAGPFAVLGDVRGGLGVVDTRTGERWSRASPTVDAPRRLAVNPSGTRLAVGRESGRVEVYSLPTLRPLAVLPARGLRALRFANDDELLLVGSETIGRWSVPDQGDVSIFQAENGVSSIAFSPDGARLATFHSGGRTRIWGRDGAVVRIEQGDSTIKGGVFVDGGRTLVTVMVGAAGAHAPLYRPRAFDAADGTPLWTASDALLRTWIDALRLPPMGRLEMGLRRVGALRDGTLLLLPYMEGLLGLEPDREAAAVLDCPKTEYGDLAVARGGRFAGLVDRQGRVQVLDAISRRCTQGAAPPGVGSVDLSADGRRLLVGLEGALSWDGRWTVAHPLPYPLDVALAPDERWVVSAGPDRAARVWDARDGTLLAVLAGHSERVSAVAVSDDGRRIATGSWDGRARLWDPTVLFRKPAALAHEAELTSGLRLDEALSY